MSTPPTKWPWSRFYAILFWMGMFLIEFLAIWALMHNQGARAEAQTPPIAGPWQVYWVNPGNTSKDHTQEVADWLNAHQNCDIKQPVSASYYTLLWARCP